MALTDGEMKVVFYEIDIVMWCLLTKGNSRFIVVDLLTRCFLIAEEARLDGGAVLLVGFEEYKTFIGEE